MSSVILSKVNEFVLRKQHLADDSRIDNIVRIARDISGLHATGFKGPYLALFARTRHFDKGQLDQELHVNKTLGKIRCMRGTLYILPGDMLPVAYVATRGLFEKLSRRYAELQGISESEYAAISTSVLALLQGRQLTAVQLKAQLNTTLHLSATLNLMCDRGLLVRIQPGDGWRSKSYKYALFAEHFGDLELNRLSEGEALALLVRSYLRSFGPASETDIAWWTGLSKARIREILKGIRNEIAVLNIAGLEGDFIILRQDLDSLEKMKTDGKHTVNLLPNLDPYLMGYKLRDRYVHPRDHDTIFDRGGNATSTILVDGRVSGIWDLGEDKKPTMKLLLLDEVENKIWHQICAKAEELGRFIFEHPVAIEKVRSMVPLEQRTSGAFMAPLRDS